MTRTILQITPYYPPHLGGIERVVEHLAELLGRDHEVLVVTTTAGVRAASRSSASGGVSVRRHRAVEVAGTPIAPGLPLSLLRAPRSAVLHLHSAQSLLPEQVAVAAWLRGQRFLVHFHGDVGVSGPLGVLLPAYKRQVLGRVLRAAAAVLVLTDTQATFVRETYRVPAERLFVVPNGVGAQYFRPVPEREPASGELNLLFVGRLSVQKNVARLLEAMSLVREPVRLNVVGDGNLRTPLLAQAERLGLTMTARPRVRFSGTLLDDDLVRAYAQADAFVLPSNNEGMPLVALEAMASALPVLATDVPGSAELLRGIGLLTDPEPGALAAAIDRLARDPALRLQLARSGAKAARGYSWEAVAKRVEEIYTHVYGPASLHADARAVAGGIP
jgi:rhamnosyl/mannosyltransferase